MYEEYPAEYWDLYAVIPSENYEIGAARNKYAAPRKTAEMAMRYFDKIHPVLDIGAGTGLAGEILASKGYVVDGVDFSKGMLLQARHKGYRRLFCEDIRNPNISNAKTIYKSFISTGVYGDYIKINELEKMCAFLDEDGIVALSGRAVNLNSLIKTFKGLGLEILEDECDLGHIDATFGDWVKYRYVIGARRKRILFEDYSNLNNTVPL